MQESEARTHADECLRMAEMTCNPADKAAWMRLAQSWMRRAGLGSDDVRNGSSSEGEPEG